MKKDEFPPFASLKTNTMRIIQVILKGNILRSNAISVLDQTIL